MRFKSKLFAAVCLVLCVIMPLSVFGASAQTVSEMNSELAKLEAEAAEINKKVNSLKGSIENASELKEQYENQIKNLEAQISTCEEYISGYTAEIETLEKEIAQKQADIESQETLLKQRIRAIVMLGQNEMSIVAGDGSFADYLSKEVMAKRVTAYDNALIDDINRSIDQINANKQEIAKKQSEMMSVKRTLSEKQVELKQKEEAVAQQLDVLYSQNSALSGELSKIRAAQDEYERLIQQAIQSEKGEDNAEYTGGELLWPVPGYYYISSPYGWRTDPFDSSSREFHKGIDIAGSGIGGKPIVAAADGKVTTAGFNQWGYGNYVVLNHGNKDGVLFTTHYAHMRSIAVSAGQYVKKGQVIGYVGTTGSSTGNHLHFEVRLDGSHTNPQNYL